MLISPTPFIYLTHPGLLIIPDGITTHANFNILITYTEKVRLLQEVTGVGQALVQQTVATLEELYLADIRNRTTNSINDTMADVFTCLQDNYGQLMPLDILERKYIIKKIMYNPREPIGTVFSAVE